MIQRGRERRKAGAEKGNVKHRAASSLKEVWGSEPAPGKLDSEQNHSPQQQTFLCRKKLTVGN